MNIKNISRQLDMKRNLKSNAEILQKAIPKNDSKAFPKFKKETEFAFQTINVMLKDLIKDSKDVKEYGRALYKWDEFCDSVRWKLDGKIRGLDSSDLEESDNKVIKI